VLAEFTIAMMTVGSVRGKDRFDIRVRVTHEGRSPSCCLSLGGQTRLKPPLEDMVLLPQLPQKGLRAFQSSRARASAYIAAAPTSIHISPLLHYYEGTYHA
jgi:hypothetical protein